MSDFYSEYINGLRQLLESHEIQETAENELQPVFYEIKGLFLKHSALISKFEGIENELIEYLDACSFRSQHFDYYYYRFQKLAKLDGYLIELGRRKIPESLIPSVRSFIFSVYEHASLSNLEELEEKVLGQINRTYEIQRKPKSGCLSILFILMGIISSIGLLFNS